MATTNGIYTPSLSHPPPGNRRTGTVRNGDGAPDDTLGQDGDVYVDESIGDIYAKQNDVWSIVAGPSAGGGAIAPGSGSPQGVVTASPGQVYWDSTNKQLWVKESGSGNTGWQPY